VSNLPRSAPSGLEAKCLPILFAPHEAGCDPNRLSGLFSAMSASWSETDAGQRGGIYGMSAVSDRVQPRELDHLTPLLSLSDNERAEVGGRTLERRVAHVSNARPDPGIDKGDTDLLA
jgi:hypothetical protein